jgi:hypothetical protein
MEHSEINEVELDAPADIDAQITEAQVELHEHSTGINELLDQSDEAQDAVDTMSSVRDTLVPTDTVSIEAMQVTQICINSLYKRLGMGSESLISLESASQNFALETVSEGIKKIIAALKKAVTYIWSKLVAFYKLVCTKILGLFKKKHKEVKTKVDNIPAEAYTKAKAAAKLEPFTDLGIFTAFAGKEREVDVTMIFLQMGKMEICARFRLRMLNRFFETYVDFLSSMLRNFKLVSSDQSKTAMILRIASTSKDFIEKELDAKRGTGNFYMTGLPYYEELVNDDSGFPRFRHQRGNDVSRTQAFIMPGDKRSLDTLLAECEDITTGISNASKLITSNENAMSQFIADLDKSFTEEEKATGPARIFLESISVNLTKVSKQVAYLNHEIITLATKSVRETYRYIDHCTKAAEEAEKH